jgi:hypothetical protein
VSEKNQQSPPQQVVQQPQPCVVTAVQQAQSQQCTAPPQDFATVPTPALQSPRGPVLRPQPDTAATVTQPAQPAALTPPVTNAPAWQPMTRRNVLRATGVAGVVAAVGGVAGYFITRSDETTTSTPAGDRAADNPIVVYVRDARTGVLEILSGTTEATVRDPALANQIVRAAR